VKTAPEKGSVFTFTVPLFGAAAQTRPPMILVAAVDEQTRREVRRLADERGYAVQEAFDGVEAVEAALRLLPAGGGPGPCPAKLRRGRGGDRLRANPVTQRVPLLVLAGRGGARRSEPGLFDGFIPKALVQEHLGVDHGRLGPAAEPLTSPGRAHNRPVCSPWGRSRPCTP
jgi:hypothetical protein